MRRIQRMLIACSGAVEDILEQKDCRADAKKYAMIGAFVLLTALFAFFSSTFALYTGIGVPALAGAIGVAWALMIFTLDRFIVSGIRKSDVEGAPALRRFGRRLVEWLMALPRILLAALISIVVATPLELRFFDGEIQTRLAENRIVARKAAADKVDKEFEELAALRKANDDLTRSTAAAWRDYSAASKLASEELAGKALTSLRGNGPVYRRLQAHADELRTQAVELEANNKTLIASNTARIDQLEVERRKRVAIINGQIDSSGGFLDRYGALGQMAVENSDVRMTRLFFMLLFLVIELTPVIMKLLMRRGAYDDYIDTLEHEVRVAELTRRSHINDNAHTKVAMHSAKNAERLRLEQALTTEAFDIGTVSRVAGPELEEAQRKVARASITDWLRKQMMAFGPPRGARLPIRKPPKAEERGEDGPPS